MGGVVRAARMGIRADFGVWGPGSRAVRYPSGAGALPLHGEMTLTYRRRYLRWQVLLALSLTF